jgi:hypothetical protein
MILICPTHKKSPCDCGWVAEEPIFSLDRVVSASVLAEHHAILYGGQAHVLIEPKREGFRPVVYSFERQKNGDYRCVSAGTETAAAEYRRQAVHAMSIETLLEL